MVCLDLHFPTLSDCNNITKERVALHYHFILRDKQVCINYTTLGYSVLVFGFVPRNFEGNFNFAKWYKLTTYEDLDEAIKRYLQLVTEIISRFYNVNNLSVAPF